MVLFQLRSVIYLFVSVALISRVLCLKNILFHRNVLVLLNSVLFKPCLFRSCNNIIFFNFEYNEITYI